MIDLGELTDALRASVTYPGSEDFDSVQDDRLITDLSNGFWNAVLDGIISGYTESDGIITPLTGTTDLSRQLQQVVVIYAAIDIVSNKLLSLNTTFRAKAGPVEYETQQSAGALQAVLARLIARQKLLLDNLSSAGRITPAYVDMLCARSSSLANGYGHWADY